MLKKEFVNQARFRKHENGSLMPIYPENPDAELRQHILDEAEKLNGRYVAGMNKEEIWYTNAAADILISERMARDAAAAQSSAQKPASTPVASVDPAYEAFKARVVEPA